MDAKVKIDESEKPIMFVKISKDPSSVIGMKIGNSMEDEFSCAVEEMKDEEPQG